jgi:hypothetical protein
MNMETEAIGRHSPDPEAAPYFNLNGVKQQNIWRNICRFALPEAPATSTSLPRRGGRNLPHKNHMDKVCSQTTKVSSRQSAEESYADS